MGGIAGRAGYLYHFVFTKPRHAVYGSAKIVEKDGTLAVEWGRFRGTLDHFETDTFRVKDGYFEDKLIEFAGNAQGPTAFRLSGLVFERAP